MHKVLEVNIATLSESEKSEAVVKGVMDKNLKQYDGQIRKLEKLIEKKNYEESKAYQGYVTGEIDLNFKDESNSITNQRAFIRSFINKDRDLRKMNVVEFVDDGYTGKNMDRPDMQRMLDLIKRKQISCVIV